MVKFNMIFMVADFCHLVLFYIYCSKVHVDINKLHAYINMLHADQNLDKKATLGPWALMHSHDLM